MSRHVGFADADAPVRHALHELCQPLTRLQWRLEVGHRLGDEATLRETVEGGLEDIRELMDKVHELRQQLSRARVQQRVAAEPRRTEVLQ